MKATLKKDSKTALDDHSKQRISSNIIHPEFDGGLTNHIPMVISALKELGASSEQISDYNALVQHRNRLCTEILTNIKSVSQFQQYFGKRGNYSGLFHFVEHHIEKYGLVNAVAELVPHLAPGLAAAAFHPLIRLGHAIADNHSTEAAHAMAYWAWAYQPVANPAKGRGYKPEQTDSNLMSVFSTLLDGVAWPNERLGGSLITEEFKRVETHLSYAELAFQVSEDQLSLEKLEQTAIQLFWKYDDFTLLHGVTGLHAARRIAPLLKDSRVLLLPAWRALVVAWLSKGYHWVDTKYPIEKPSISLTTIRKITQHSQRDHTIKLVAACLAMHEKTADTLYWYVAEREVLNDDQLADIVTRYANT